MLIFTKKNGREKILRSIQILLFKSKFKLMESKTNFNICLKFKEINKTENNFNSNSTILTKVQKSVNLFFVIKKIYISTLLDKVN